MRYVGGQTKKKLRQIRVKGNQRKQLQISDESKIRWINEEKTVTKEICDIS